MNNLDNPVAQGDYDDTFEDAPEQEIRCPHCGALWELRTLEPTVYANFTLYSWDTQDGESSCCTRDVNAIPVNKEFCYACAYETATVDDLKEFAEENMDDFRAYRCGL